jgi:hypothetical protein
MKNSTFTRTMGQTGMLYGTAQDVRRLKYPGVVFGFFCEKLLQTAIYPGRGHWGMSARFCQGIAQILTNPSQAKNSQAEHPGVL